MDVVADLPSGAWATEPGTYDGARSGHEGR